MKLHLTKLEARALVHRLSVGDAISECLTDYGGEFEDMNPLEIEKVADALACRCEQIIEHRARGGKLTFSMLDQKIATAVLRDAIEGSTWGCCLDDMVQDEEITVAERAKHRRAMRNIERKVRAAGIETSGFPDN